MRYGKQNIMSICAIMLGAISTAAHGAYWDTSASSGIQGGNGSWDGSYWNSGYNNSNAPGAWTDGGSAVFYAGTSTVTNNGNISFTSISLSNDNTTAKITGTGTLTGATITVSKNTSVFELAGGNIYLSLSSNLLNNGGLGTVRISSGTFVAGTDATPIDMLVQSGSFELTGGTVKTAIFGLADKDLKVATASVSGGTMQIGGDFRFGVGKGISAGGTATMNQSGGNIIVSGNLRVGNNGGTTGAVATYNLSGGTLSADNIYLYTDTGSLASINLSGNGKLLVKGTVGLTETGSKSTDHATNSFNFTGGTLAVGTFKTDNFSSDTLTNAGGTLALGDLNAAGKTIITGNYAVTSATAALAVDIGGTTRATAFAGTSGQYDYLSISGNAELAGLLTVNLLPGFTPDAADSFTIVTASSVTGAFGNIVDGYVATADGTGKFLVTMNATSVVLSGYVDLASAPEPASVAILAAGCMGLLRRRKNG